MSEPLVKVSFEGSGFEELRRALKSCNLEVLKALTQAMVENTEDLLGESMKRAPLDEGFLRGSGSARVNRGGVSKTIRRVDTFDLGTGSGKTSKVRSVRNETVKVEGSDIGPLANAQGAVIEGEVSFNTPYAARQHEETGWKHQHGEAKYLENPLKERAQMYLKNLAEAAKEALKRAGK